MRFVHKQDRSKKKNFIKMSVCSKVIDTYRWLVRRPRVRGRCVRCLGPPGRLLRRGCWGGRRAGELARWRSPLLGVLRPGSTRGSGAGVRRFLAGKVGMPSRLAAHARRSHTFTAAVLRTENAVRTREQWLARVTQPRIIQTDDERNVTRKPPTESTRRLIRSRFCMKTKIP